MARINLHHHIANITTDNNDDCWAASTAMVMHRHSINGTNHVKALAAQARIPLSVGTLPDSSVQSLARVVRLGYHAFPRMPLTFDDLEGFLKRGPVVAFGFYNYPGMQSSFKHAVAIYAMIGDGTPRGTKIYMMDPASRRNPFSDDWQHFDTFVADITHILSY